MTMRILLVDDETEFVATLAERLSLRNMDVDYATTAQEALALAESHTYELAVLDMKMPGTSGLELQATLKERCPAMKFIFLTGHGSETDYITGSSEASSYLVKPVAIDILIAKIREALGKW